MRVIRVAAKRQENLEDQRAEAAGHQAVAQTIAPDGQGMTQRIEAGALEDCGEAGLRYGLKRLDQQKAEQDRRQDQQTLHEAHAVRSTSRGCGKFFSRIVANLFDVRNSMLLWFACSRSVRPPVPALGFVLFVLLGGPTYSETTRAMPAESAIPVLASLDHGNADLQRLRKEIADNLRCTMREGRLCRRLRYVRYTVGKEENFYEIMARLSQDADTLASLNELANPNALLPGQELVIPNARGLFVRSSDERDAATIKLARQYEIPTAYVLPTEEDDRYFLPGRKYLPEEERYFRGEGFLPPLRTGRVSSSFGTRIDPFTRRRTFHGGVDIAAPQGTSVYASRGGKVVRVSKNARGYGKLIVLEHDFGYHTYYGHLSRIDVRKGAKVRPGQVIGAVGATGRATGPHLHFEVRKDGKRKNPASVHGLAGLP